MPDLLKVLLIDDNPDDRILIIRELRKLFLVEIVEVIDKAAFEAALVIRDFDIIITDYQLRWTTGIEVLIRVKASFPAIPVIMFTATGNEEIAVRAMKIGLDDYIMKSPDHYLRLAMSVKSIIERLHDKYLRKSAETALQKSEENYKLLVENIDLSLVRLDASNKIVFVNSAFEQLFKTTSEKCKGKYKTDFYDSIVEFPDLEHFDDTFEESHFNSAIAFGVKPDGSKFEIQLKSFPTYDENNRLSGYVELIEDVSGKLRSERIQQIIYNISHLVMTIDSFGSLFPLIRTELSKILEVTNIKVVLYNQENASSSVVYEVCEKDKQWPVDENSPAGFILKTGSSLLLSRNGLQKLLEEGKINDYDTDCLCWMGVPLKNNQKVLGALILKSYSAETAYVESDRELLQFVSNQIGIYIDIKISQEKLKKSELLYRSIIEQSVDGVMMLDEDGKLVEWNRSMSEITRLSEQQVAGKYVWEIKSLLINGSANIFPVDLKTEFNELKSRLLNGESSEHQLLEFEHSEHGLVILSCSYFLIKISAATNLIATFVKDVTEQKLSEKTIQSAKLKAEQSDRLKTAFLANISHEIRTPLNAIVGFAELQADGDYPEADRLKFSEQIISSSGQLLSLFDKIIIASKIEAGVIVPSKSNIDLSQLLLNSTGRFKPRNERVELRLKNINTQNHVYINTDVDLLQLAIDQLIDNAIKFTAEGVVEIELYESGNSQIEISISDTGPGIPEEKLSQIFDKFRQADEGLERNYSGLGVGLHIAKKIIHLLGGTLNYQPAVPKGSRFLVSFASDVKNTTVMINKIDSIASSTDQWVGKVILIVEDVDSNFQFLNATLRRSGAQILWVKKGEDALEMINSGTHIDVILMDVQLEGADGYSITREIKKIKPGLPVIAQTAFAMKGEKEKSQLAGCDDYLSKPIRPTDLIQTLSKYL